MIEKTVFNDAKNTTSKRFPKQLDPKQLRINMVTGHILLRIYEMEADGCSDEEINAAIKPEVDHLVTLLKEKES